MRPQYCASSAGGAGSGPGSSPGGGTSGRRPSSTQRRFCRGAGAVCSSSGVRPRRTALGRPARACHAHLQSASPQAPRLEGCRVAERQLPHQQLVQHQAEAVDVGGGGGAPAAQALGSQPPACKGGGGFTGVAHGAAYHASLRTPARPAAASGTLRCPAWPSPARPRLPALVAARGVGGAAGVVLGGASAGGGAQQGGQVEVCHLGARLVQQDVGRLDLRRACAAAATGDRQQGWSQCSLCRATEAAR